MQDDDTQSGEAAASASGENAEASATSGDPGDHNAEQTGGQETGERDQNAEQTSGGSPASEAPDGGEEGGGSGEE